MRIDAKQDRPWTRKNWKHPMLRYWTRKNRAALVHAVLGTRHLPAERIEEFVLRAVGVQ